MRKGIYSFRFAGRNKKAAAGKRKVRKKAEGELLVKICCT
jgi:hypothetical protein